ncbi:hypothetical protein K7432_001487 [Basidiobolus ranarum]|uniref:Uncharacterized protein n=1 Tax=Basidiobolus ranarum TaxID=34480 RepID=A0ABR2X2Z5_9FUNG
MASKDYEANEVDEGDFEVPLGLWGGGFSHFEINQTQNETQIDIQPAKNNPSNSYDNHSSDDIDSMLARYYPEEEAEIDDDDEHVGLWTYPVPSDPKYSKEMKTSTEEATLANLDEEEASEEEYDEEAFPLWFTPNFQISNSDDKTHYKEIVTDGVLSGDRGEDDFIGTKKYFERVQSTSRK